MFNNADNVGMIHGRCAEERHQAFQKKLGDGPIPLNSFAKLMFTNNEFMEYMWVKIDKITGDDCVGVLDNDPVFLTNVKCGDVINFKRADIHDIMI